MRCESQQCSLRESGRQPVLVEVSSEAASGGVGFLGARGGAQGFAEFGACKQLCNFVDPGSSGNDEDLGEGLNLAAVASDIHVIVEVHVAERAVLAGRGASVERPDTGVYCHGGGEPLVALENRAEHASPSIVGAHVPRRRRCRSGAARGAQSTARRHALPARRPPRTPETQSR